MVQNNSRNTELKKFIVTHTIKNIAHLKNQHQFNLYNKLYKNMLSTLVFHLN